MSAPSPSSAQEKQLRLLNALDEAAAKLEASERKRSEPIAIIGAGCRFPGPARDLETYWRLLAGGVDTTTEMPLDRWDIDALYDSDPEATGKISTRRGGFLSEIDRFDAELFNISPREAIALDPQHRLLLEVAHEALDSAGQLQDRLTENLTGVFVGITSGDYAHLLREHQHHRPLDAYFITGNAPNSAAGRLSHQLGLRGPSMVVDTACSSSLTSVHIACQSLRQQECNVALAGGVNLMVMPDSFAALSRARMLAADGRCKTFDDAADGYGRGEGGGLIVLKRLSDAQRDGDVILATIRGGAINHDGPSSGFTVPNGAAQRALLQSALAASRLTPEEIDYVEAHGTGTSLGDPIEVNALAEVYGANRRPEHPLLLGSVKSNLGHLESAAGIAGLLKVALSLWHRQLPRHLHCNTPSTRIAWDEMPIKVTQDHQNWPDSGRPRRAGLSSFGVSGTNAHLILEEAPAADRDTLPLPQKRIRGERRFWAFPRPQYEATREWLHHIAWAPQPRRDRSLLEFQIEAAADQVTQRAASAASRHAGPAYRDVLPALEQLAATYAANAIKALGDGARVVAGHRRLWTRLPQLVVGAASDRTPAELLEQLLADQPDATAEIRMLERCGTALAAVLAGEVDPLSLLFPADVSPTAADLYSNNPIARSCNDLMATWVATATPPSDEPLRILEIGAGTGATTVAVLAALGDRAVDYTFTDVSPLFLQQAKARFRDVPHLSCRVLDIEQDPLKQGFSRGEFDLIIAANVIHATADLCQSLRHAHRLLAPGGQIALIEITSPAATLDLIFGLTDGWWRFTDHDLRPGHPLIGTGQWLEQFQANGFTGAQAHQLPESAGEVFRQQALLTATATAQTESATGLTGRWLFIGEIDSAHAEQFLAEPAEIVITPVDKLEPLSSPAAWDGVVYFPASQAAGSDAGPLQVALTIAHTLIDTPAPWWIVTQGAVSIREDDIIPHLAAAGLWGFARTLAQEHPELRPHRIDWEADAPAAVDQLIREFQQPNQEDQIAFRGGARFSARLEPTKPAEPANEFSVSAEGTVLVIGGTGGLGLSLARWLAVRGAKHLVLAARRPADTATRDALGSLKALDVQVSFKQVDVSQADDVARLLAEIAAESPPLCGVVHSAGVLDDGALRQLDWSRFETVLAPKVAGAWHLHKATRDLPLDFFVLFSSSTALLGTPGQANHAAANSWLDSLAAHRRAQGLPAVSINWGPWADIGAAARRAVPSQVHRHGVGSISATKGWFLLGEILAANPANIGVLPITWSETPASLVASPFFDQVRRDDGPAAEAIEDSVVVAEVDWADLPPTKRIRELRELISRELGAVLGTESNGSVDPAQGFFDLGMDSLMATELRNRLQKQLKLNLPSTIVFDHATVAALAEYLSAQFAPSESARAPATPALSNAPAPAEDTARLNEDELSSLLEDELKDL